MSRKAGRGSMRKELESMSKPTEALLERANALSQRTQPVVEEEPPTTTTAEPVDVKPREEKPVVEVVVSRCPKCQSTSRTPYTDKRVHNFAGVKNGVPFTHVIWRPTKCRKCGQARVDKFYELSDGN